MSTNLELDLVVDLNTTDDAALPWTFLDEALNPERIVPGAHILLGSGAVRAVAPSWSISTARSCTSARSEDR